jgi:hypothetical protein
MNTFFHWLKQKFSHQQARRRIQLSEDNLLSAAEQRLLDEHLSTCGECRAYSDQLHVLEDALLNVGRSEKPRISSAWSTAQIAQSRQQIIVTIQARYRRHTMGKRFISIAGALAVLGIFVAAFFLFGKSSQSPDGTPATMPSISTTATTSNPLPGNWVAITDFGKFILTVNDSGTRIIKTDLQYSDWTCGSTHHTGEIVDASDWQIIDYKFSVYTPFDKNSQSGIYINGIYDANTRKFSGTWEEFSGTTTCSGTWEASSPK